MMECNAVNKYMLASENNYGVGKEVNKNYIQYLILNIYDVEKLKYITYLKEMYKTLHPTKPVK